MIKASMAKCMVVEDVLARMFRSDWIEIRNCKVRKDENGNHLVFGIGRGGSCLASVEDAQRYAKRLECAIRIATFLNDADIVFYSDGKMRLDDDRLTQDVLMALACESEEMLKKALEG